MMYTLVRNALLALLLNGGVAYALNDKPQAPATVPVQSCAVPVELSADPVHTHYSDATGVHS